MTPRANARLPVALPEPVKIPKYDPICAAVWWCIFIGTALFWYWVASCVGIVPA